MSLNLTKVELSNIRSHQYVKFEPAKVGITALSGPNGSGKSTIVDSIAWTLYGTKPHGVSKTSAIVKEGTDISKNKVYARVDIKVDNTDIRIERRIVNKTGSVECEVWEKPSSQAEFTDKDQKAGPSVSHSEPYIKQRLKMDEKGFLAAILVQQKQVDQLISATPKERAEVIEKLTGIASITTGLTEARQNYNSMKKTLSHFQIDEGEYEKMLKEKEAKENNLTKYKTKLTQIKDKMDKNTVQYKKILQQIKIYDENAEAFKSNSERKIILTTKLESIENELEKSNKLKKLKKAQIDSLEVNSDYNKVEGKITQLRSNLMSIGGDINKHNDRLTTLKNNLNKNLSILNEGNFKSKEIIEKEIIINSDSSTTINEKINELRNNNIMGETSIKSFKNAIKIIDENSGACPTCLQEVKDKDEAIKKLNEDIKKYEKNIAENSVKIDELNIELQKIMQRKEELTNAIILMNENASNEDEIKSIGEKTVTLKAEKITSEKELKALEKIFDEVRQYKSIKDEYDELARETVQLSDHKESLQSELRNIDAMLNKSNFNANVNINSLRNKGNNLMEERGEIQKNFNEYRELYVTTETELKYLTGNISKAKNEIEKYSQLLKNVETSGATVSVLEEFREERINNSVPVVSAYASDLLNRFTNGKFTQLILDKKFNATVTLANGVSRGVGLLSGGELSSAAMSLRLAISLLLNKGSANSLLILDEVLVSMDSERSELILNTIKDIFNGQLVFISHGANTNEIADYVVEL